MEKALVEKTELENNYQLHFYALFLLAEFQDREFFSKIIEFISISPEALDYLIGDMITSGLPDIIYNTYNGNIDLLKNTVANSEVDQYVRSGLLSVMGQLYLDGTLEDCLFYYLSYD